MLRIELGKRSELSESELGNGEQILALLGQLHRNNLIVIIQIDSDNTDRLTSGNAHIGLIEADRHTLLCDEHNILLLVRALNSDQLVALAKSDRDQADLTDIRVLGKSRGLDDTALRSHQQIAVEIKTSYCDGRRNMLIRLKLEQVDDRGASRGTRCLRDLISLQSVNTSLIREEQDKVMIRRHEELFDEIIVYYRHALDSLAAAVLRLEIVGCHSLDVAESGHSNNGVVIGNQIFCGNIVVKADRGLALVTVFIADGRSLVADYGKKDILITEDSLVFFDLLHQLSVFSLKLLSFQTGQLSQTHIHNGLSLRIVETESVDKSLLSFGSRLRSPDQSNDLVNDIKCLQQTFLNVGKLFSLVQVELCTPGNNVFLMLDVKLEDLEDREHLGLVVHQSEHIYAEGILQLGMLI